MGLLLAAKSSTKLLAPTDPILGPENLLKTGFAQKGLPSCLSSRHKPQSFIETKTLRFCNPDTKNFKKWTWTRSQKWDRLAVPFLGPHAQLSKRTKEKYFHGMSNKVPSSEVTKWILRSSHDSFVHFCDDSAGKTKAKHMENGLIFHVTIQIQILTMFSVQSKYSKKTKSISLLGFVISNKTCKIWNVQIQCQPSRLSSPSRWKPNSFLPMQKRPMDSSHHRCQIFTLNFSDQCQTKYDLLTIPSCTSAMILPAKLKKQNKHMENGLIFHVTIQIQILTMFSVQSKYSKKTKSISLSHFWDRLAVPLSHFWDRLAVPKMRPQNRKIHSKGRPVQQTKLKLRLFKQPAYIVGTEEGRTCEAWFQLTSDPRNGTWKRTCGISCLRSLAPMWRFAMQHHPGNIHQSFATPRTPLLRAMF